jgi:hypothetical protein
MAWARATREPSQGGVRDSPPAWHDERQLAGWQSGLRLTRSNVPAAWLLATRWDIVLSGIGLSPAGRFVSRPTQHSAGQHLGYGVTFAPPVPCRRMPARPDVWAGGQGPGKRAGSQPAVRPGASGTSGRPKRSDRPYAHLSSPVILWHEVRAGRELSRKCWLHRGHPRPGASPLWRRDDAVPPAIGGRTLSPYRST